MQCAAVFTLELWFIEGSPACQTVPSGSSPAHRSPSAPHLPALGELFHVVSEGTIRQHPFVPSFIVIGTKKPS